MLFRDGLPKVYSWVSPLTTCIIFLLSLVILSQPSQLIRCSYIKLKKGKRHDLILYVKNIYTALPPLSGSPQNYIFQVNYEAYESRVTSAHKFTHKQTCTIFNGSINQINCQEVHATEVCVPSVSTFKEVQKSNVLCGRF